MRSFRIAILLACMGLVWADEPPAAVAAAPAGPVEGQAWTVPEVGMEFVWIAALNGWVGKYEVTNGEYRSMKAEHDSKEYQGHSLNADRQPVVYVNFADAQGYAAWLTARERQGGRLPAGMTYRLPMDQEWETFASCGDRRTYPWGNDLPPKQGNYAGEETKQPLGFSVVSGYRDGQVVTAPVEQSGRNDWGLYGVGGNVWEVTTGNSDKNLFGAWRGASWSDSFRGNLRVTYRLGSVASARDGNGGFRLLLSR